MSEPHATHGPRFDEKLDTAWDADDRTDSTPLDDQLPAARRRHRWLTAKSATLAALLVGLIGFYAGIREEKARTTGSSSATASLTAAGPSKPTGAPPGTARSFGLHGGNLSSQPTTGTVQSVNGNTIYVKESSGNTIKVKLLATSTISKSQSVTSNSVHPGDSVTIQGSRGSGTLTATSVSDSGATSSSTSSSSGDTGITSTAR